MRMKVKNKTKMRKKMILPMKRIPVVVMIDEYIIYSYASGWCLLLDVFENELIWSLHSGLNFDYSPGYTCI